MGVSLTETKSATQTTLLNSVVNYDSLLPQPVTPVGHCKFNIAGRSSSMYTDLVTPGKCVASCCWRCASDPRM
eukprot:5148508-Amphidinium_carterae.1